MTSYHCLQGEPIREEALAAACPACLEMLEGEAVANGSSGG